MVQTAEGIVLMKDNRSIRNFMVFDVESIGLHGEGFAVGWVVVNELGYESESGLMACDPYSARGTANNHSWVTQNIALTSKDVECHSPGVVRQEFWQVYERWKAKVVPLSLWADCAWPVEARFLIACIEDAHLERQWNGPYPLHDIATLALACGADPLGTFDRLANELPAHNPLNDARQSARLLIGYLRQLGLIPG